MLQIYLRQANTDAMVPLMTTTLGSKATSHHPTLSNTFAYTVSIFARLKLGLRVSRPKTVPEHELATSFMRFSCISVVEGQGQAHFSNHRADGILFLGFIGGFFIALLLLAPPLFALALGARRLHSNILSSSRLGLDTGS